MYVFDILFKNIPPVFVILSALINFVNKNRLNFGVNSYNSSPTNGGNGFTLSFVATLILYLSPTGVTNINT